MAVAKQTKTCRSVSPMILPFDWQLATCSVVSVSTPNSSKTIKLIHRSTIWVIVTIVKLILNIEDRYDLSF